jgi:hypothetical protein
VWKIQHSSSNTHCQVGFHKRNVKWYFTCLETKSKACDFVGSYMYSNPSITIHFIDFYQVIKIFGLDWVIRHSNRETKGNPILLKSLKYNNKPYLLNFPLIFIQRISACTNRWLCNIVASKIALRTSNVLQIQRKIKKQLLYLEVIYVEGENAKEINHSKSA